MPKTPNPQPENPDTPEPLPDYPTDEQMEKIFNAWRKDGEKGIAQALDELYPRKSKKQ